MKEAFIIGLTGGSASGKTTVAARIIEELDLHWVVILSMDSFYKVLSAEQSAAAHRSEYNFDHPDAFDFSLLVDTLKSLKAFRRTEVPQYDFSTHSRMKDWKTYYGANVILFEGILSFVNKEVRDLLDVKIFVDTDSDIRLCRRLSRDISERGRDLRGVLKQYGTFVKPAFDSYIEPTKLYADIIVPRGAENEIAIDMIVKLVSKKFEDAGTTITAELDELNRNPQVGGASPNLLPQTNSVRALHTKLRNRKTPRDQFIFYSLRLMRLLVEYSLSLLPYEDKSVTTHMDQPYQGLSFTGAISAVSVLRSGETLEQAVAEVVKDAKIGKLLIQTNRDTLNPELYYIRLPKDIKEDYVLLLDSAVTSGAALLMAIRILLDHEVEEERIIVITLVVSQRGLNAVSYVYPKVRIVTSAVDEVDPDNNHFLVPGIGNFGDRFFGTDISPASPTTAIAASCLEDYLLREENEPTGSSESYAGDDIEDYSAELR